ncbi:MAG: hypothetical protein SGPRY_012336, partial [Prymnesium sp.]
VLLVQHRMHPSISLFPSITFYEGALVDGVTALERESSPFPWPGAEPLAFYSMAGPEERPSLSRTSYANTREAQFVSSISARLLESGVDPADIAMITPYSGQRRVIRSLLPLVLARTEVDSVDSFQGRESDYVIISLVRSNPHGLGGFVGDPRRLHVALTRARRGLVLVGDLDTLMSSPLLRRFLRGIWAIGDPHPELQRLSFLQSQLRATQASSEHQRSELEAQITSLQSLLSQRESELSEASKELLTEQTRGPAESAFDRRYDYDRNRVVELSLMLLAHLEAKPPSVDASRILGCIRSMYSDWSHGWSDNPPGMGIDLRMLLSITIATKAWFTPAQLSEISAWYSHLKEI